MISRLLCYQQETAETVAKNIRSKNEIAIIGHKAGSGWCILTFKSSRFLRANVPRPLLGDIIRIEQKE